MTSSDVIRFDLYYDYQCPFVYRAFLVIDAVKASGSRQLDVTWRYFSLTQVNSREKDWTVWGAPADEPVKGRLAFAAAEAARRQNLFDEFHPALLAARHLDALDIDSPKVVEEVAVRSGLELDRFRADLAEPDLLLALARDHQAAIDEHGVFGTPTLVFPDGSAAYVRLGRSADGEAAVDLLDRIVSVVAGEPLIREIKRPSKPAA